MMTNAYRVAGSMFIVWQVDCYLIAGERFKGDVIYVACKMVDDVLQINTAYLPHPHLWIKDRIRRVRKRRRKR